MQQLADDNRELRAQIEAKESYREEQEALVCAISAQQEEQRKVADRCLELQSAAEEFNRNYVGVMHSLFEERSKVEGLEGSLKAMERTLEIQIEETSRAETAVQGITCRYEKA